MPGPRLTALLEQMIVHYFGRSDDGLSLGGFLDSRNLPSGFTELEVRDCVDRMIEEGKLTAELQWHEGKDKIFIAVTREEAPED